MIVDLTGGDEAGSKPRGVYSAAAPLIEYSSSNRASSSISSSEVVVNRPGLVYTRTIVSFSLVNLKEFTVRADCGPVSQDIISTLKGCKISQF